MVCISFEIDLKKNEIVTYSRCYFNKSKDLKTYFKYSNSFFPEAVLSKKFSLLLDQITTKSPASGLSDEMNRMSENGQSKHKVLGPHSADISNTTMHKPMFEPQKPLKNKRKRTQMQKQKRAEKRNINKSEKIMRKGKGRRIGKEKKNHVKKFDKNVANKKNKNKNKPKKGNNGLRPHLGYSQYDEEKSRKETGILKKDNRIKPDKNRRSEKERKREQHRNLKKMENVTRQNKRREKKFKNHGAMTKKAKRVEGDDEYVYSYFD